MSLGATKARTGQIRVLVADDSPTVRAALWRLLGLDERLTVVGQASDGVEALAMAKSLRPDVITMDVRMPNLDGLEATAAIMATSPARILLVCSVSESDQQDLSFRAMDVGALEVIAKPSSLDAASLGAWGRHVADSIALMAEVPVVTRRRFGAAPAPVTRVRATPTPVALPRMSMDMVTPRPVTRPRRDVKSSIVGIVASTGGPPALAQILAELPANLGAPVLLAQHMAEGFTSGLVRWLGAVGPLKVRVAEQGEWARAGFAYLPMDGHDLIVEPGGRLRAVRTPGGHCPSGDRLLTSLAEAYGARAAGIVLTGMGDDGAEGLMHIRQAGGATFAQDAATSVVYGMPQAAWTRGAAETQLPLAAVSATIRELCGVVP